MYELIPFDAFSPAPARDLAELHSELLPTSPVVKLGRIFLERFYYADLPRAGLLFGAVAKVGGRLGGFVTATDDAAAFARSALRGRRAAALRAVAASLAVTPGRIATLVEVLRLAIARSSVGSRASHGEILSMGVREEFRAPRFVAESGLHIAHDLTDHVVENLRDRGCERVLAGVDADNLAARFFYRGMGWSLVATDVAGWRCRVDEYVLDLRGPSADG